VIYLQQEFLRVDQCDALGRDEQLTIWMKWLS